ncbi:hypothetical protein ACFLXI_00075 [Chloroflexota bacterium]
MNKIRTEHLLYLLAFLLALGIRMLNLGDAPLSDYEADWALQSLALARGDDVILGAQPGYIFLTLVLFQLFGATAFLARFWPALAGSLLVMAPYAFRGRLGQKAAIIVAFGLALDPGMVALSRLAGGPMPAIAFTILALALLYAGQPAWGGIAAGLALLSGPAVLIGLLGLGIAFGIARLLGKFESDEVFPDMYSPEKPERNPRRDWGMTVLFGGGTILFVSTLFFRYPQGLGSLAATLSTFLQGWVQPSNIPVARLLAAIIFYAILAFVFGLAAGVRGWLQGRKTAQFFSIWFLVAVLIVLVYPARQMGDIAWALVPLWALAGLELARSAHRQDQWLISLGQAAAVFVLMIVIWLTLAGLDTAPPESLLNYWFVIGAAAIIGVLVMVLVYLGWGWRTARIGLVWGLVAGLGVYSIANAFGVSQVRPSTPLELWVPTPTTRHAELFTTTLADLALSQTGHSGFLEVVSLVDAPSMRWILRNIEGVVFVSSLGADENPLVVIAREGDEIGSRQEYYRGQDFGWWVSPGWGGALPWEPIRWIINREGALLTEKVVLWAQVDLFPEEPEPAPEVEEEGSSPLLDEGVEIKE